MPEGGHARESSDGLASQDRPRRSAKLAVRLPLPEISAAGSPLAAALGAWSGVPWYVYVAIGLSGPAVYLVNCCMIYLLFSKALDLFSKALDKVESSQVAELMTMFNGLPPLPPGWTWKPLPLVARAKQSQARTSDQDANP